MLSKHFSSLTLNSTRLYRVLMGAVLLLLSLQLLGLTRHDHAYADTKADCASCFLIHQLPADVPPPMLAVVPVRALAAYPLSIVIAYSNTSSPNYLIPHAQAPPAPSRL